MLFDFQVKADKVAALLNSRSSAELKCHSCDTDLYGIDLDAYEHDGGWKVPGIEDRQWLSICCPKCNHNHSLSTFGVPR